MQTDKSAIERKLIELAAEQAGVGVEQITPATHFRNDLNFDSLDEVEYAMAVEDEFKLTVNDEEAERFKTVEEVVEFVAREKGDDTDGS
jgi:acyl carrier protein